jgi:hypothetical protein
MAEEEVIVEGEAPAIPDIVGGSMADLNRTFGNIERAFGERSAARKDAAENIKRRGGVIEDTMKALAERKLDVAPPKFEPQPFQAPTPQYNPAEAFGSTAATFGLIASLFTKQPLTSALNASAAAMTAFKKRDIDAYDKAFNEWKVNSDYAWKRAQFENDQYKTAIDLMNQDFNKGYAQARMLANLNNDEAAIAALSTDDPMDFFKLLEGRSRLTDSLLKQGDALTNEAIFQRMVMEKEEKNGGPLTGEQLKELRLKSQMTPRDVAYGSRGGSQRYGDLQSINSEEDRLLNALRSDDTLTAEERAAGEAEIKRAAEEKRKRLYAPKNEPQLAQKLESLRKAYPTLDEPTLNKLATGKLVVRIDPVTKRPIIVDVGTNQTVRTVEQPQEAPPVPAPIADLEGDKLWDLANELTGPEMALISGVSKLPVVGSTVSRKVSQARSTAEIRKLTMQRALAQNPRFPVAEMKKIENAIDIGPQIISNPSAYKGTLISVDKELAVREATAREIASDTRQSPAVIADARNVESLISSFRKGLGVPETRFDLPDRKAGRLAEARWILSNPPVGSEYVNYLGEPARVRR